MVVGAISRPGNVSYCGSWQTRPSPNIDSVCVSMVDAVSNPVRDHHVRVELVARVSISYPDLRLLSPLEEICCVQFGGDISI